MDDDGTMSMTTIRKARFSVEIYYYLPESRFYRIFFRSGFRPGDRIGSPFYIIIIKKYYYLLLSRIFLPSSSLTRFFVARPNRVLEIGPTRSFRRQRASRRTDGLSRGVVYPLTTTRDSTISADPARVTRRERAHFHFLHFNNNIILLCRSLFIRVLILN